MECLNFGDGKFSLMSPLYQNQSESSLLDEVYMEDLDASNLMKKNCLFDLEYNIEDQDDGWNMDLSHGSTNRVDTDYFLADSGSDWSCSVNSTQDTLIDTNTSINIKIESTEFTSQVPELPVFETLPKSYYEFLNFPYSPTKQVPAEIMKPEKKPAYIRNLDISNLKRICEKAKEDNTYLDPTSIPLSQLVKPTDVLNVTVKSELEPDLLMDTSFDLLEKELDIDKLDLNEPDGDFDLTSYITGDWEGNLDVDAVLSGPPSPIKKSPIKRSPSKRGRSSPVQTRNLNKSPVRPIQNSSPIRIKKSSSPIRIKKNSQVKRSSPIQIEKHCSSPIRIKKCESDDDIDVETVSPSDVQPILQATDVTSLLEQFEANEVVNETVNKKKTKKLKPIPKKIKKKVELNPVVKKNPVIGPVSNSKPISYDDDKKIIRKRHSKTLRATQKSIFLDHDYCAVDPKTQPQPREISKQPADYYKVLRRTEIVWGQGIASKGIRCTEPDTPPKKPDDTSLRIKIKPIEIKPEDTSLSIETKSNRSIINSPQKIKKFKESKLVSVLKSKASMEVTSNTVIATINEQDQMPKKRKLNLEEYKKLRSCEPSRTNSPSGSASPVTPVSTANEMSPAERLLEMAAKVLATKPSNTILKCELQPFVPPGTTVEEPPKPVPQPQRPPPQPQNDKYEMKTFVSMGINTDITVIQTTRLLNNQKQAKLKADQKIKELITPILQNAGSKINSNSLISNIKDTMLQKVKPIIPPVGIVKEEALLEHGENKIVVHLEKDRVKPEMVTMETQTEQWEYEDDAKTRRKNRHYRKRSDSNSSSSSVETTTSKNSRGKNSYHSKKSSKSLESSHSNWSRQSRSRSRSLSEHSRSSYSSSSSCSSRSSSSSSSCSSQRSYSGRYYKRGRRSRHSQSSYGSYKRRSPRRRSSRDKKMEQERMRQVEERRVIYVGRLLPGTTKHDLKRRFHRFGPILETSVHFREQGDNYGFVTFEYKQDAFDAIEKGNDDPNLPKYDISFGGRRAFCQTRYADLDNSDAIETGGYNVIRTTGHQEESFETLLQQFQAKLRKRQV